VLLQTNAKKTREQSSESSHCVTKIPSMNSTFHYFYLHAKTRPTSMLLSAQNRIRVTARANGTPRRVRPFGARDRPAAPFARMRSGPPPPRRLQRPGSSPRFPGLFRKPSTFSFSYLHTGGAQVAQGVALRLPPMTSPCTPHASRRRR
jgi:hypothetical protein